VLRIEGVPLGHKLRGGIMKTVILEVRSLADTLADAASAMKTSRAEHEARIGFATSELLWKVLAGGLQR
jgi:hypothetical protein